MFQLVVVALCTPVTYFNNIVKCYFYLYYYYYYDYLC